MGCALLPGETVSAVPKLDGYTPGRNAEARDAGEVLEQTSGEVDAIAEETADDLAGTDGLGTWIEIDIQPLFPSSDSAVTHLVDLTEDHDPEAMS